MPSSKYAAYEAIRPYFDLVPRGRRRPPLAVVQKSTYAEQKRCKRISFRAEIEEPDSDQNAYHGHGYYFEHGVGSGAISDRAPSAWQRASFHKCAVG
jgi:hypothetical protein